MPLTDMAIKKAAHKEKQYRLTDGRGLNLLVHPNGSKYWQLRYRHPQTSKGQLLQLGRYPDVSLAEARALATEAKATLAAGVDPNQARKQEKATKALSAANTVEAVAWEWFNKQRPHWAAATAEKTTWLLNDKLLPYLGKRPIAEVLPSELLAVLRRIETTGAHETANKAKRVTGQIWRYAVATDRATRDITQDLKGALATPKVKHRAAITDPKELGKLLLAMDSYQGSPVVKAALLLSPLFFCRPGELRQLEWAELNLDELRIEIPADKMKMREPHIIPLCQQAVDILQNLRPLTGYSKYIFPSARGSSRCISENAVRVALRSLGYTNDEHTPHGFRATARTILDEVLGYRVELIEHQSARAVSDPMGRAYNRTAHLPARKEMMQGWADYLDTLRAVARGENVIPGQFIKSN